MTFKPPSNEINVEGIKLRISNSKGDLQIEYSKKWSIKNFEDMKSPLDELKAKMSIDIKHYQTRYQLLYDNKFFIVNGCRRVPGMVCRYLNLIVKKQNVATSGANDTMDFFGSHPNRGQTIFLEFMKNSAMFLMWCGRR